MLAIATKASETSQTKKELQHKGEEARLAMVEEKKEALEGEPLVSRTIR